MASADGIKRVALERGGRARKIELAVEVSAGDVRLHAVQLIHEACDAHVAIRVGRIETGERKQLVALEGQSRRSGKRQTREATDAAASWSSDCGLNSGRTDSSTRRPPNARVDEAVDRMVAGVRLVAREIERTIDGQRQPGVDGDAAR